MPAAALAANAYAIATSTASLSTHAAMGTLVTPELQKLSQGSAWVELYTLDATAFGGSVYNFCNQVNTTGGNVVFGATTYQALPIEVQGWDFTTTGTSAKPTLSISNLSRTLLAAVISQGDLVGAKLTRIRTLSKFLADGSSPNSSAFIGPNTMIVEQKIYHDRTMMQWQLTNIMDRLGMLLPRRQILKDPNHLGCNFPGVARNRP